jgi:hypothetical protein
LNAPIAFFLVFLPIAISDTITGKHNIKQKNKYMMRNAAPPPLLTSKGNFQMLPNPTAEPEAAKIKPSLELNDPLFIKNY